VFISQQRPQHITKLIYCSRTVPELEKVFEVLVFSNFYACLDGTYYGCGNTCGNQEASSTNIISDF